MLFQYAGEITFEQFCAEVESLKARSESTLKIASSSTASRYSASTSSDPKSSDSTSSAPTHSSHTPSSPRPSAPTPSDATPSGHVSTQLHIPAFDQLLDDFDGDGDGDGDNTVAEDEDVSDDDAATDDEFIDSGQLSDDRDEDWLPEEVERKKHSGMYNICLRYFFFSIFKF